MEKANSNVGRILFATACLLAMAALIGCGGGGGDSSSGGPVGDDALTGVFLDNAVEGLMFKTPTQSGKTDEDGTFYYMDGETVTFSLGGARIGQAPGAPIVTPLDLWADAAGATDPRVTRVCQLLQGLDDDGDLTNGIHISDGVSKTIDLLGFNENVVERYDKFNDFVDEIKKAETVVKQFSLPSEQAARDHLRQTLATFVHPIDVAGKPSRFVSAHPGDAVWDGAEKADDAFTPPETDDETDGGDAAREIEEADIIKIDGDRLFILNQYRGLILCDILTPDRPAITGRLPLTGEPLEMYIRDNRAYILARIYGGPVYGYGAPETTDAAIAPPSPEVRSRVYVVDIGDPNRPSLAGQFDLTGDVIDSRIVGDVLYVVYSETFWFWPMRDDVFVDGVPEAPNADLPEDGPDVFVASFNVSDPEDIREVDQVQFDGSARHIHVTETAVFVAGVEEDAWGGDTRITYVDIADPNGAVRRRGDVVVNGQMADEFKMDFYNDHLRAVTYLWENEGESLLSIIDASNPDALTAVGEITLGQGEQLFATRFDGHKGYLVTYERKDPLWVLDLSDPANPKVEGELIVPGWSTHIEPLGDRLVALGVDDENGWKVAVSLFDVSDPTNPSLINRLSFGEEDGWSHTAGYNDVKAFTVLEDLGLILLPYTGSGYADGTYQTDHRLQLIDYSPEQLVERGWVRQKGDVLRGRVQEDRLFSVSSDELQVIDAADRDHPQVTATLALAANISDFMPLDNGHGVQGVYEDATTYRLQSVPLSDPDSLSPVGSVTSTDAAVAGLFGNGHFIYLASNPYNAYPAAMDEKVYGDGATRLTVYDFENPDNPIQRGSIDISGGNVRPVPMPADANAAGAAAMYPYYGGADLIQVKPDVMALIQGAYDHGYYMENGETTGPQLTTIDLSDPDAPAQAAQTTLDAPGATAWFARNNILYFSYPGERETNDDNRTLARYYLGRVDLTDPANPAVLAPVNIPGVCVGMEGFGPYIYTIDRQWIPNGGWEVSFNSLKLVDGEAYLLDGITLENQDHFAIIADGLAWLSSAGYMRDGGGLTVVDLTDPENLAAHKHSVTGSYPRVIGASGAKAFVNVTGGTACYDASVPADLRLDAFKSHGGWSDRIRFKDDRAYLPLGYFGVWARDL